MAPLSASFIFISLVAVISFFTAFSAVAGAATAGYRESEAYPGVKTTHLHFYLHEIFDGPSPSLVRVAESANVPRTQLFTFGDVMVADNPLTEGPEPASKLVGRAQGMYSFSSREPLVVMLSYGFVFVGGEHNGSALTVTGRNPITEAVREVPVVGGSGSFRWARGYALLRTVRSNPTSLVTIEYNVTVVHP